MGNRLSEQPGEPQARRERITRGRRLQVLEGVSASQTHDGQSVGALSVTKKPGEKVNVSVMARNSGDADGSIRIVAAGAGVTKEFTAPVPAGSNGVSASLGFIMPNVQPGSWPFTVMVAGNPGGILLSNTFTVTVPQTIQPAQLSIVPGSFTVS